MRTKQVLADNYCEACRHYLEFRCDIFNVNPEAEQRLLCDKAGYREIKHTNSSVRTYNNRQGAPNNGDVR